MHDTDQVAIRHSIMIRRLCDGQMGKIRPVLPFFCLPQRSFFFATHSMMGVKNVVTALVYPLMREDKARLVEFATTFFQLSRFDRLRCPTWLFLSAPEAAHIPRNGCFPLRNNGFLTHPSLSVKNNHAAYVFYIFLFVHVYELNLAK